MSKHISRVVKERLEYRKKMNKANLYPDEFCSIYKNGADQSEFGLPHFVTNTKSVIGNIMKVRLIGVLEHLSQSELHLHTMIEEHETGANHILETLHCLITDRAALGLLPSTLYLKVDNCTRENKNSYFFASL